jgi:hypothetical protein
MSLKNEESQMFKVIEVIKSSLNEVSLNELPSGCDDDLPVVETEDKFRNSSVSWQILLFLIISIHEISVR